jgi:hypothetical protein
MEDFFRANLPKLSGSESKLVLTLLHVPEAWESESELKRLSGVTDRFTFRRARRRLAERGWFTYLEETVQKPTVEEQKSTPLVAKADTMLQKSTGMLQKPTPLVAKADMVPTEDFETILAEADDMDGSGDERLSSSPFQKRRKQQMALLHQAWLDLFGMELAPIAAKELLQTARSQALDVYRAMQQAKDRGVEYPKAYVRKVLTELAKKPPTSAPTELGDGRPVTDEMRKSWDKAEARIAKSGLLDGWDLD